MGQKIGSDLDRGQIIALTGELGSGKTTFVQGLALGLGIDKTLISPTFILMRQYRIHRNGLDKLYHIDLYRLDNNITSEIVNLGFSEIVEAGDNVIVVEWADKTKDIFTKNTTWFEFSYIDESKRRIISYRVK
ncbi:tRNA (adenosine(37)-N6)-threonylcarbamoyltransferase complex ATPase subunit type 1 TsaE [Candidatus Woesebacteria bacterium]|nr:MAG: tRNA (adenosine(37)-N6)-threonylcarbamoyltransferase complex ATPase subunit type 1 TsaE [Candidatus Woesebacteria bacterium]